MEIVEVFTAGLVEQNRKLLQGGNQNLKRVAKHHVIPPLHLELLLHVLTDHLYLAVWSLSEFVNNQMCVVATEVVEQDRDLETDQALQVAHAVSGAKENSCNVVMVTHLRLCRIILFEHVATAVAHCRVLILLPLLGTNALNRLICPELLHNCCLPLNEHVKKIGQRILFNFHHVN